jgi:hypothetical protein
MLGNVLSRLLHDPVSVYLLFGSVVATVAVGLGIIWEHGSPEVRAGANRFVIGGIILETFCTVVLFAYDASIIGVQNDKLIALQARPWTKAEYDALQKVKGKITDIGVIAEKDCIECGWYARFIERALHDAGVQLYGDDSLDLDWMRGSTGIQILLPAGTKDPSNNALVTAFKDANVLGGWGFHAAPARSAVRTDIPVIYVGERFVPFSSLPYFPEGGSSWTILPLKNPTFDPATAPRPH